MTHIIRLKRLSTGEEWDQDFETPEAYKEWRLSNKDRDIDWVETEWYTPEPAKLESGKSFARATDSVRLGRQKPEQGFRDLLRHIKKQNPRSNINTF
jgi:hypothetical protein